MRPVPVDLDRWRFANFDFGCDADCGNGWCPNETAREQVSVTDRWTNVSRMMCPACFRAFQAAPHALLERTDWKPARVYYPEPLRDVRRAGIQLTGEFYSSTRFEIRDSRGALVDHFTVEPSGRIETIVIPAMTDHRQTLNIVADRPYRIHSWQVVPDSFPGRYVPRDFFAEDQLYLKREYNR